MTGTEYYIPQYQTRRCAAWVSLSRNGTLLAATERVKLWAANLCVTKARILIFDSAADLPECRIVNWDEEAIKQLRKPLEAR